MADVPDGWEGDPDLEAAAADAAVKARADVIVDLGPNVRRLLEHGVEHGSAKRAASARKRVEAAIRYIETDSALTIRELAAEFDVPVGTMQGWAASDGWVDKRNEFRARITQQLSAKLKDVLTEAKAEDLRGLLSTRKIVLSWIERTDDDGLPVLAPTSLEGAVTALHKLTRLIGELRGAAGHAVEAETADPTVGFSEDELARMAAAVVDQDDGGLPAVASTAPGAPESALEAAPVDDLGGGEEDEPLEDDDAQALAQSLLAGEDEPDEDEG